MRFIGGIAGTLVACAAPHVPMQPLPGLVPTLEPSAAANRASSPDTTAPSGPVDPYGPEPALHSVVGDHISSDVEFGDPGAVTAMVVRVRAATRLPSNASHHVVSDAVRDWQEIAIRVGPGAPVTAAERTDGLRATAAFDANHPAIRAAARAATFEAHSDRGRIAALVAYVYQRVTYTSADETVASVVLARGSGDCTEMSLLFIALARAAGIPARSVVGLAATQLDNAPAFGFHAWAEVALDGHWVAVDPTWDEPAADATHLMLAEGTIDDAEWARVAQLQVAVLDLQRDERLRGRANARALVDELPVRLRVLR